MLLNAVLGLISALDVARAHGGHHAAEGTHKADAKDGYIRQHMINEHHIDSFDMRSFFILHDLNLDSFWERSEIEAVYGVHHMWNPKDRDEAKIKEKADAVVDRVLKILDKDGDGRVSLEEFEAGGVDALPDMKDLGAEGHHYDVESEFFLHHEEIYHSTPESQTDEAYTHPEDIEHFANHEHIEAEEEKRERDFHGLTPEEFEKESAAAAAASSSAAAEGETEPGAADPSAAPPLPGTPEHPHDDDGALRPQEPLKPKPKVVRPEKPEKMDPSVRFKDAKQTADQQPKWGEGDDAYKRPKTPADKMRRNMPYKYKFRRNWGDF